MKDALSNTRSETDFALVISREVRNRHLRPRSCSASEDMLPSSCDPCMCRSLIRCSLLLTALSTSSPVCDGVSNDKRRSTAGRALISPSICAESHRKEGVYLTLFNDGKPFKQPVKKTKFVSYEVSFNSSNKMPQLNNSAMRLHTYVTRICLTWIEKKSSSSKIKFF